MENTEPKPLTYGQRQVGLTFNPSGDDRVAQCKQAFADEIDRMNDLRNLSPNNEDLWVNCTDAITFIKTAQMWAVKALTWK